MLSAPAVSVVVPVYNPGAYLRPLLDSLLAQTEPALEIVAVDDGSTDGSGALLREAAARDPRLVVVTRANGGYAAARNSGIDAARGTWIGFADSDDWLDPRTLQCWRELGERERLDVVFGNGFRFRGAAEDPVVPTGDRVVREGQPAGVFSGTEWIARGVERKEWLHFVWLQLVRREALLRTGLRFDESIVHEDVLWSLELGLSMQRIGWCEAPLYGYRIHATSFTHDRSPELLAKRAAAYIVLMGRLVDAAGARRGNARLRRALLRHAQREGRRFHALMRPGTLSEPVRRELAREFLGRGLIGAMFAGAENASTAWRALRCWCRLQRSARSS